MKKIIFFTFFIFQLAAAQDRDSLFESLFEEEMRMDEQLLPQKMIFSQSLLCEKVAYSVGQGYQNCLLNKGKRVKSTECHA